MNTSEPWTKENMAGKWSRGEDWIMAAHNDTLAAERNEHGRITANLAMQVQDVTHQLTTVRELREIDQQQLAAEREKGVKALAERSFELHECQKQLAAERENCKSWYEHAVRAEEDLSQVVDALKEIRSRITPPNDKIRVIEEALAKVKQ